MGAFTVCDMDSRSRRSESGLYGADRRCRRDTERKMEIELLNLQSTWWSLYSVREQELFHRFSCYLWKESGMVNEYEEFDNRGYSESVL